MGGWAIDPDYALGTKHGPALAAFARLAVPDSPIAARLDAEWSRATATYQGQATDISFNSQEVETVLQLVVNGEMGIPLRSGLEAYGVGGLGYARLSQRTESRTTVEGLPGLPGDYNRSSSFSGYTYHVGVGVKVGHALLLELRLLQRLGARYRLATGIRF